MTFFKGSGWKCVRFVPKPTEFRTLGRKFVTLNMASGRAFMWSSWTRIDTPHGQMKGTFFCMTEDAQAFDATVPEFQLVYPGALH